MNKKVTGEAIREEFPVSQPVKPGDRQNFPSDQFSGILRKPEYYGVRPGFTPYLARNSDHPRYREIGEDRPQEIMDTYPGAYICSTDKADSYRSMDSVLMAVPDALVAKVQDGIDAGSREWSKDLEIDPTQPGVVASYDEDYNDIRKRTRKDVQQERARNVSQGLTGPQSPTHGLSLMEANALMAKRHGPKHAEMEQARYRQVGNQPSMGLEEFQARISGKKTFGMGDTGFGRNAKSPLAQAAARKGRA